MDIRSSPKWTSWITDNNRSCNLLGQLAFCLSGHFKFIISCLLAPEIVSPAPFLLLRVYCILRFHFQVARTALFMGVVLWQCARNPLQPTAPFAAHHLLQPGGFVLILHHRYGAMASFRVTLVAGALRDWVPASSVHFPLLYGLARLPKWHWGRYDIRTTMDCRLPSADCWLPLSCFDNLIAEPLGGDALCHNLPQLIHCGNQGN